MTDILTVREFIAELEEIAGEFGDELEVVLVDEEDEAAPILSVGRYGGAKQKLRIL